MKTFSEIIYVFLKRNKFFEKMTDEQLVRFADLFKLDM
jgi:hypothetical protein